jgi:predicted RNase H-like nuclease (RuvC/YqgF family)
MRNNMPTLGDGYREFMVKHRKREIKRLQNENRALKQTICKLKDKIKELKRKTSVKKEEG